MSQANTVISHLINNRKLTSVEAIGLYGITRLASVVHAIKSTTDVDIITTHKVGVNNRAYAIYSLAK